MRRWHLSLTFVVLSTILASHPLSAQSPRVLQAGQLPNDVRLGELKTLNGHFPFVVPDSPAEWLPRAEALRRRVLVANGLWPMPEKTPLEPVIHGKVERDGFTVEKVYFQSMPGHFVTGLLFRPSDSNEGQKMPGVLCPHGHGGRLQKHSDAEIARQISIGAEHFEASGRTPKLARCAQLARMGCVTLIFDMLGYVDSLQISRQIGHRHQDPRPEEAAGQDKWILYSPEADLRLQSVMGLQTWNAIRALDFLAGLPDVDADRLAVTGGSGGGTQSILLGAIDERIKVSFPNGMVSTSMQGGCYCENCNLLRIGTGNVELAALFAPRPQAMTAADDWTRDMMKDGYPELKWLYAMLGNEDDVYCRPMLHFKHNYNYVARATMYQWMNRHLELGLDDPVIENDFVPLTDDETAVWNQEHPAPKETGVAHERRVCQWFDEQASEKLHALVPHDEESLTEFRKTLGGAWQVLFDLGIPSADNLQYQKIGREESDGVSIERGLLRDQERKTELPLLTVHADQPSGKIVIWSHRRGKHGAFDNNGKPSPTLRRLIERGATVMIPDLLGQGEFNATNEVLKVQRLIDDKRAYSAFTFGYNRTLVGERCGDLLAVIAHALQSKNASVRILGSKGTAFWVTPAASIAGVNVHRAAVETSGDRFGDVTSYRDANFAPGSVKYGDIPTLLALRAPYPLRIAGEAVPKIVTKAFDAANAPDSVGDASASELTTWVTE